MANFPDILVNIPDDHLPKLSTLYSEVKEAPHIFSLIENVIKLKKQSEKNFDKFTFMSPHNSWQTDGTIIVVIQCGSYDVIMYTLDQTSQNLYEGLMKTKRIDFSKTVQFFCVSEPHISIVKRVINDRHLTEINNGPCIMYALSVEKALAFTIEAINADMYVKKLEMESVARINSLWPHKRQSSERYLGGFIEMNGGYGVYLKSSGELVAWVIKMAFGHVGILQTVEEHKRKGCAKALVKTLSKEIGQEGHRPFGTITVQNADSQRLFEGLGFEKIGNATYIHVEASS